MIDVTFHPGEEVNTELKHARLQVLCDALTSGEYQQTTGFLERIDPDTEKVLGHCCLGVAAREAMKMGLPVEVTKDKSNCTSFNGNEGVLDYGIFTFYGLPDGNPEVKVSLCSCHAVSGLAQVNDSGKYDFPAIAKLIKTTFIDN
jgi:hypothetical protein